MENRPALKVSVIIPLYNVASYIEKCLQSVRKQTYKNLEIIIVNDCSTDGSDVVTHNLISAWKDERFSMVHHKKNKGLSGARNTGLDIATGDLLQFVDSDDWCCEDMVETMVNTLIDQNCDIVNCNINIYDEKAGTITKGSTYLNGVADTATAMKALLLIKEPPSMWRNLYKRSYFDGVRFSEGLYYEDKILQPYIWSKAKNFYFLDKHLYNYVVNRKDSITTGVKLDTKIDAYKLFEDFNKLRQVLIPKLRTKDPNHNWNQLFSYYDYIFFRDLSLWFIGGYNSAAPILITWLELCQNHFKWRNLYQLIKLTSFKDVVQLIFIKLSPRIFWVAIKKKL